MNKINLQYSRQEVEHLVNEHLKKIPDRYKAGNWIDYKTGEADADYAIGLQILGMDEHVHYLAFARAICFDAADVRVDYILTELDDPEEADTDFNYAVGTDKFRDSIKIEDQKLNIDDWSVWGLNRFILLAAYGLKIGS